MTLILPPKLDQSYRVEGKREYLKNFFYSCNLTSGCSSKSKIGNRGNTEVKQVKFPSFRIDPVFVTAIISRYLVLQPTTSCLQSITRT